MVDVWDNLTQKEKRLINEFNKFDNRTKMAPEYSDGAQFKEIDQRTKLLLYKKLIDTLEPSKTPKHDYIPMQKETTHSHDYVPHGVKPIQSIKLEKINDIMMQKYSIKQDLQNPSELPKIVNKEEPEYEWILVERNPIKPVITCPQEEDKYCFDTTYSSDFKPKKRVYSGRPIRHDTLQLRLDDSYDKETSYNIDFTEHKLSNYYFLPRDDYPRRRAKSSIRTNKRYFNQKELKLMRGYYNPYFNFDDQIPSKNLPNPTLRYETMKPTIHRSKSFNFDLYKLTPERHAINNQFQNKARVLETMYNINNIKQ